jgi:hypothetical protein
MKCVEQRHFDDRPHRSGHVFLSACVSVLSILFLPSFSSIVRCCCLLTIVVVNESDFRFSPSVRTLVWPEQRGRSLFTSFTDVK